MRRLSQNGGYFLSAFLIAWLIKPIIAITLLETVTKITVFIGVPYGGALLISRFIEMKREMLWKIAMALWVPLGIGTGFYLMNEIEKIFS